MYYQFIFLSPYLRIQDFVVTSDHQFFFQNSKQSSAVLFFFFYLNHCHCIYIQQLPQNTTCKGSSVLKRGRLGWQRTPHSWKATAPLLRTNSLPKPVSIFPFSCGTPPHWFQTVSTFPETPRQGICYLDGKLIILNIVAMSYPWFLSRPLHWSHRGVCFKPMA